MTTKEEELIETIAFAMNRKTANEVKVALQNRDDLLQASCEMVFASHNFRTAMNRYGEGGAFEDTLTKKQKNLSDAISRISSTMKKG